MDKELKTNITEQQIASLKDGIKSQFWLSLKQIVVNEKEELEQEILESESLSDKQRDDLRRWRNFLVYFINLPEKCIESLESKPVNDGTDNQDDGDPYEKEQPLQKIRNKIKNV